MAQIIKLDKEILSEQEFDQETVKFVKDILKTSFSIRKLSYSEIFTLFPQYVPEHTESYVICDNTLQHNAIFTMVFNKPRWNHKISCIHIYFNNPSHNNINISEKSDIQELVTIFQNKYKFIENDLKTEKSEDQEKHQLQKELKVHHFASGVLIALSVVLFMSGAAKMDKQDVLKQKNAELGYEKYTEKDIPSNITICCDLFFGLAALLSGAVINKKGCEKEERFSKKRMKYGTIQPHIRKLTGLSR